MGNLTSKDKKPAKKTLGSVLLAKRPREGDHYVYINKPKMESSRVEYSIRSCTMSTDDGIQIHDLSHIGANIADHELVLVQCSTEQPSESKVYERYSSVVVGSCDPLTFIHTTGTLVESCLPSGEFDYSYVCDGCKYHVLSTSIPAKTEYSSFTPSSNALKRIKTSSPNGSGISSSTSKGDILPESDAMTVHE